jgi:hypothetical protein
MFLEQIRYLYLPKIGLQLIASSDVSDVIRNSFLHNLVEQHWHRQGPLPPDYQAVYLYQPSLSDILFGWMYIESASETLDTWPFFIGYYLSVRLSSSLADIIFAFLSKGPMICLDSNGSTRLAKVPAPDLWNYQPQRPGIVMSAQERQYCYDAIRQSKCANAFTDLVEDVSVFVEMNEALTEQLIQILTKYIGPIARLTVWQLVEDTAKISDSQIRTRELLRCSVNAVAEQDKTAFCRDIEPIFGASYQILQPQPQKHSEPDSQPLKWRGNLINL